MAKILIGNVKPVKGVDYFTPEDIEEMGKSFVTKEDVADMTTSVGTLTEDVGKLNEDVGKLDESLKETQEAVAAMDGKFAPVYTFGTEDLEAGTTPLETGRLHFVYEE